MTRVAIAGAALLALAGCGVVYTAPSVSDGGIFGTAYGTDLEVRVVRLSHETAQAANLDPYVPPRLPAAFRADAVASMAELGLEVPDLPPLPSPTARRLSRPEVRRGELPPPADPGPYRIGVTDGVRLAIGQTTALKEFAELPPLPSPTARNLSRPDVRPGELPPPAERAPYRIGIGDGLLLGIGQPANLEGLAELAPPPSPTARPLSRPEVRRGELPPQTEPEPYHIGVGDVLMLALRDIATLEELPGLITAQSRRQGYVVQDDGSIGIPSAGRIRVAGLTLQDAEAAIFEALVAAGIDPAFSLEIQEFNSQRVSVGGLVGAPTLVPITVQTLHLDEAIQLAGGLRTEDRSVSTIQLFRQGTIYEIPVERYIDDPAARRIILRDGDSIFVGTRYREAEAQRYFEEQMRLRDQELQGAQFRLQLEQIRTQREAAARERQIYKVQDDGTIAVPGVGRVNVSGRTLQEAEAEIAEALAATGIAPSLSLEISEFNSRSVSVGGLVGAPQLVPITLEPLQLHEAFEIAGGITAEDPSVTTIQIFRDGAIYRISLERFLGDPEARRLLLRDGDSIFVGTSYREAEAQRYFEEQLRLREQRLQGAQFQLQVEQLRTQREAAIRDRPVYSVQDDGAIGIPEAGRVRIAGLTLQEAEAEIAAAFAAAGIDPPFAFEIAQFNARNVSVGGLVGAPQLVPITTEALYLHEAIEVAGGLTAEDPSVTTLQIFRDGTVYRIGLERFLDDPAARRVRLKDGDSVFVGTEYREAEARRYFEEQLSLRGEAVRSIDYEIQIEQLRQQREARAQQRLADERDAFKERLELGAVQRPIAYRAGEVRRPGRFPLPFEGTASLADVLFDDEGIDIRTGDYGEIYLLRWPADSEQFGSVTAYHLNAENAVNLAVAAQFELRPNDVVFVSEQAITSWNRVFSQILPQIFLQAGTFASR